MATRLNELMQAKIEARNAFQEEAAKGEKSNLAEVENRRANVALTEREYDNEVMRANEETARLALRPSGRVEPQPAGLAGYGTVDPAEGPTNLPPLPARTRQALARLYPQAGAADRERRAQNWHGVVSAALGGQPLHPAVLAATGTEGLPSDGGFMVTAEVAGEIFTRAVEESVWLRVGARLEVMTSEEKIINALDDSDETDDAEATLKAAWTDEGGTATEQLVKVRQVKLKARKLLVLAAASNELVEDGTDYLQALELALSLAIAKKFDRSVLSGTGAGMPLGILNSPATIVVAKETQQPNATYVWENAVRMWSRLAPGSHERAWWLMHPTVLPQALSMSLVIGTGGAIPRAAFEAGGPTGYMLLGRPVLVTSRVKTLGTQGDVILVDPTQIAVGVRRGIAIERSEHAFFGTDRLAVRGKFRGDALPLWEKPQTLAEGSTTVSPVVVLANRP